MFLWLTHYLTQLYHGFHVFQYITLRAILGALTALSIALLIGPKTILYLMQLKLSQTIRDDGPKTHLQKAGTPTMGGAFILIALFSACLLWGSLTNRYVWLVLLVTLSYGFIGWVDDYRKVTRKNTEGLRSRWKFFWQSVIGLLVGCYLFFSAHSPVETQLVIPFIKGGVINLGWFYIPMVYFVIVGSSNAVNLTDGLDGLAIVPVVMIAIALGIFAYASGNATMANYLGIPYVPEVGEVAIVCAAFVGAGLGFLWFNAYPAQVFMGDVGALGLGAGLGAIAVLVRQELIFFLMSGIFVAETISVILQVASFKLTGKRIFRMAPLHHHFELKGWPEPHVIIRFWIIAFVLVLIGLASLKVR